MTTAWFVISIILGIIWLIAFIAGIVGLCISSNWRDNEERKDFLQVFAAIMAAAFFFVFLHWIILVLAIPVFVVYGLVVGIKLLVKRPWKEEV